MILNSVRSSECPVTLVPKEITELCEFMLRAKWAMRFSNGTGFGANLLDWPQWLMDAVTVLQCAETIVDSEFQKAP